MIAKTQTFDFVWKGMSYDSKISRDKVFPHSYSFENGLMHPGDAPGLGVDIDEALAAQHPYQRAHLLTNRKLDGTMHDS
jgi:L-alanine-DL-glutamate epimerase-like enolase superfamily enzyme